MEFKQAYEALKQGAKIKRPHWRGFWMKENETITMHCKDGSVIPFLETEDIFVDLDNIVADDWVLISDCDVKDLNITTFTFGEALSNLKRGKKVARKGWNAKYKWLCLVKPDNHSILYSSHCREDKTDGEYQCLLSWIGLKTVDDKFTPWMASQTDMLSDDWMVVE